MLIIIVNNIKSFILFYGKPDQFGCDNVKEFIKTYNSEKFKNNDNK